MALRDCIPPLLGTAGLLGSPGLSVKGEEFAIWRSLASMIAILLQVLLERTVSRPRNKPAHSHRLTLLDVRSHRFSLNSTQLVWHPTSCFCWRTMWNPNRSLLVAQTSPPTYDHERASRWRPVEPLLRPRCPTSPVSLHRPG